MSSLSYRWALAGARALAAAAPRLLPGLTATVRANLELAYGAVDERIVRGVYRHFAESTVDLVFSRRLVDGAAFELVGDGWEHWRRERPRCAVVVTGHFGNWELYGGVLRREGVPVVPVVRPPNRAWFARWLARFREAQGMAPIPKKNALPLALQALRRGEVVAFLNDQAAGRHGIDAPFFGRPVRTFTAPIALARKQDCPLYCGYSTRLGDGIRYRCHAEVVDTSGDVAAVTARLNARLEAFVRACPEQWWWFHKRFKPARQERRGRRLSPAGVPVPE